VLAEFEAWDYTANCLVEPLTSSELLASSDREQGTFIATPFVEVAKTPLRDPNTLVGMKLEHNRVERFKTVLVDRLFALRLVVPRLRDRIAFEIMSVFVAVGTILIVINYSPLFTFGRVKRFREETTRECRIQRFAEIIRDRSR
jgi:sugar (pentulose or hexulose) kinase